MIKKERTYSIEQSYFIIYEFLSLYWFEIAKYKERMNDSFTLVTIISVMDPIDIENPIPVDPTKYEDWIKVVGLTCGKSNNLTCMEIFNGMISYLEYHIKEFNIDVRDVVEDLKYNFNNKYLEKWNKITKLT